MPLACNGMEAAAAVVGANVGEPLKLDVEVTYRKYSDSYRRPEYLPVRRWTALPLLMVDSSPTLAHLIMRHSFFFLKLNLSQLQCSDGNWSFGVVKKPCPDQDEMCLLTQPHLWISHDEKTYRTQDLQNTLDPVTKEIKIRAQDKQLVIPGRVYDITFSFDAVYRNCSCSVFWMSVAYNTCHGNSVQTLVPLQLLNAPDWERIHSVAFK